MGYRYDVNRVEIRVEAAKVPQMFDALASVAKASIKSSAQWRIRQNKENLENGRVKLDSYISRLNDEIKESESILQTLPDRELSRDEILDNLEWRYSFDGDGSLSSLYHPDDSKDLNEEELEAIAPFVNDDSFIEAGGEDFDDLFRYVFRDGKMRKVHAVISFPEQL